jgi:short-subunit dehydrogenase
MEQNNKRVVITGAGRGLGAALAIVLADAGANLILLGRTPETLAVTASAVEKRSKQKPLTLHADMADMESVENAAKSILEQTDIDVLINNAAFYLAGKIGKVSSVESILFALERPRNCTLSTIVLDADAGGLHSPDW